MSGTPPTNYEGLGRDVVRTQLEQSLERLGLDRVGVYYGHVDDRTRAVTEIADTFADLVEQGLVTIPGLSNTATWRLAVARQHSRTADRPQFGAWQQQHSIYWPTAGTDDGTSVTPEGIDYAADHPELTIMSYSPQQGGQLVRPWLPLRDSYDHPGSVDRLRRTHEIAHELDATANQVVLAWHLGGVGSRLRYPAGGDTQPAHALPPRRAVMVPVFSASTPAQVDEAVGALALELSDDQRAELDRV